MDAATLQFDISSFEQQMERLGNRAPLAIARALNRGTASAKTLIVREVAKDLGLKQADMRDRIVVTEARPDRLSTTFYASAKRIPLIDFRARGPEPSRGRGRGVTARLPGGAGRYPKAFIATMKSGHRGVFQRSQKSRLPVYELFGPSIAQSFVRHRPAGIARGQEQIAKNLRSEFSYALSKLVA